MAWVRRFGEWHSDSCQWVITLKARRCGDVACSCAHDAGEHYCEVDGECTLLQGLSAEELANG